MPPNDQFIPPAANGSQPPAPLGIPPTPMPGQPGAPQASQPGLQPQQAALGAASATRPTPSPNSTQSTLQLSEIRDNMVVMIDGSFRAVIACKSINFDLMSEREREGVEFSYQNFLNSLNFPVQILVRSQRIDIGPYIEKLLDTRRSQDNMLLGVLMDDYINFIDILSQEANIMEKSFFIVIPYFPQGTATNFIEQGKGFFGKLFASPKNKVTRIDAPAFQKAKDELKHRVDAVVAGLYQIGVQSVQLDTKSLGELYYNFYNPDTAVRQPLGNFDTSTSLYIKRAGPAPEGSQ